MLKTNIVDPSNNKSAEVDSADGEKKAVVVATRDLKTFKFHTSFFTNDDYGIDMNVNAATGGTPLKVHNGIDDALWTGSSILGSKFTFNSTDFAHAGSNSIKIDNPKVGNILQLAKGSSLDVSGYVSLTMWVYVASNWGLGDSISIYGWNTGTGLVVGNSVNLENYFNYSVFGVWRKISIPLSAMSLASGTIDALRVQVLSRGGPLSPTFYLDDMQFEETGAPIAFKVEPDKGTWFHVTSLSQSFADAYDGTLTDGTMFKLSYDKILGETLAVGYLYRKIINNLVDFSITKKSLSNILQFPNAKISSVIDDGTNVFLSTQSDFVYPLVLKSEDLDRLEMVVQEDLTGLLLMRISVDGYVEIRD